MGVVVASVVTSDEATDRQVVAAAALVEDLAGNGLAPSTYM